MELNGDLYLGLYSLDKVISIIRLEKTCHILNADRVSTHFLESLCVICKILIAEYGTCCIRHCRLNVSAFLLSRINRGLKVSGIVESVENTDFINTVSDGLLNKIFNNIVGIMTVAENILTSEKHLEFCVLDVCTYSAKPFPRIFIQEAKASVKCSTAPRFERVVTDFVESFQNRKHLVDSHSRCNQ